VEGTERSVAESNCVSVWMDKMATVT